MYKVFESIDCLYEEILEDKNWTGAESALRNRYPMRFVLFENFTDFNEFVTECTNHNVYVDSIEDWLPNGFDDQMLTHSQLAEKFKIYVKSIPTYDYLIAPFSEITRFYDNEKYKEFDSLVKTIRLIESPEDAQNKRQRIYIPIIGMQSKIDRFKNDPNIHVWEYKSGKENINYRLILTKGTTYGVKCLESKFTVCKNLREWISLWKTKSSIKKDIICSSKAIFNNAMNARPDNAFDYCICENVFDFLTNGLSLDFGKIEYHSEDLDKWTELADSIDIDDFNFDNFVFEKFNAHSLEDSKDFVQAWFENKDIFSRWLLSLYYLKKDGLTTYLNRVLAANHTESSTDLFSNVALHIFEEDFNEDAISERLKILTEASKYNITITEGAENKIIEKLNTMAESPELGFKHALKFLSPLSNAERLLMIQWLGDGRINRNEIKDLYPDLYHYTTPFSLQLDKNNLWVNEYFTEYCNSKIANSISERISQILQEKNRDSSCFNLWKDNFKTVKTFLHNRDDIDMFYWIDGLGIDWIPYLINLIKKHEVDGVYLNEIHIATAELPTCTENNKKKLQELTNEKLSKIGDIDSFAHKQKSYPSYIPQEFKIIENSLSDVFGKYNGKKIAFVSDHGISYLSGLASGMNLGGITTNHAGRCGEFKKDIVISDNKYIILEDNKTVCSLLYNSLTTKTPEGQGAHGGATPEEVLVPIIIVSNHKNAGNYSIKLLDNEISSSDPVLKFEIKGLSNIDKPSILYNDIEYSIHKINDNLFESERINLIETCTKATIHIGNYKESYNLIVSTGVKEDDLFNF